jgi:ribonuclease HI
MWGIILDLEGQQEFYFTWRLGEATNNEVDALALIQDF